MPNKEELSVKTIRELKKQLESRSIKPEDGMYTFWWNVPWDTRLEDLIPILQHGGRIIFQLPEGKGFKKYRLVLEEVDDIRTDRRQDSQSDMAANSNLSGADRDGSE